MSDILSGVPLAPSGISTWKLRIRSFTSCSDDCAAPASTPFKVAIDLLANSSLVAILRIIKSNVSNFGSREDEGDENTEGLDKISGRYVSIGIVSHFAVRMSMTVYRPWCFFLQVVRKISL